MTKTYRRADDGVLHYREVWDVEGGVLLHRGQVGRTGRSEVRGGAEGSRTGAAAEEARDLFLARARADGYAEVPDDELWWAVLQCWLFSPDLSHPADDWIMGEGHEALDEYLGWRGLGHLDGNDLGGTSPAGYEGPKLNLFCRVVDGPLAVGALRGFVRKYRLPSAYVIGLRAPGDASEYEFAYSPRKSDTVFELF